MCRDFSNLTRPEIIKVPSEYFFETIKRQNPEIRIPRRNTDADEEPILPRDYYYGNYYPDYDKIFMDEIIRDLYRMDD